MPGKKLEHLLHVNSAGVSLTQCIRPVLENLEGLALNSMDTKNTARSILCKRIDRAPKTRYV